VLADLPGVGAAVEVERTVLAGVAAARAVVRVQVR
jgi:hypothetical protein